MHEDCPVVSWYVIDGMHDVQTLAPAELIDPVLHMVQTVAPSAPEKYPALHDKHVLCAVADSVAE